MIGLTFSRTLLINSFDLSVIIIEKEYALNVHVGGRNEQREQSEFSMKIIHDQ
ncbi:MAG: hypothetical protein QS748_09095 [Candidatus Endonucleobacter bathymodioli]|uniref:Uncharacterized protein n=1 Tax=Candidatus Endonucleibacter bathymodioli TaxID=539814 RepID=A0AA90NRN3_9GAMM|nr:hypothetical protein [Candidatus Endonucleobacter bathymodioli]